MSHTPAITVLIDEATEAVGYDGRLLAGLVRFKLEATANDPLVVATYKCFGAFPHKSSQRTDAYAEEAPLQIHVNDLSQDLRVYLKGTWIHHVKRVNIELRAVTKRKVTITFTEDIEQHLKEGLLALGVEVIVEPD